MRCAFGEVELDAGAFTLRRAGEPVHVEPRVFDLLVYLIEHRDAVVSKEELVARVWGGAFVTDSALKRAVLEARRAVGDDGARQWSIRTVHGRGYRFVAALSEAGPRFPLSAVRDGPCHEDGSAPRGGSRTGRSRRRAVAVAAVAAVAAVCLALLASAVAFRPGRGAASSPDSEAYHAYLRGRAHAGFFDGDHRLAADLFARAVRLDPAFAAAHARLSMAQAATYHKGLDRSPERLAQARQAALRAIALDPELADAHRALGYVHYWGDRDYDRALAAFIHAAERGGTTVELLTDMALILRRQGRFDEALDRLDRALPLDPLSAELVLVVADTRMYTRRYAEADASYARVIALAPDLRLGYALRALNAILWRGDLAASRAILEEMPGTEDGAAASYWCRQLAAERDFVALLDYLDSLREEVVEFQFGYLPVSLLEARAHHLADRPGAARRAYEEARSVLERTAAERPQDARVASALGLAYAGLGRAEEALAEGRRGVDLSPVARDAFVEGTARLEDLAEILALLGRGDEAVEQLESLLARPSWVSTPWLALDPRWDSLRDHPGFERLLAGNAARPDQSST